MVVFGWFKREFLDVKIPDLNGPTERLRDSIKRKIESFLCTYIYPSINQYVNSGFTIVNGICACANLSRLVAIILAIAIV